MNYKMTKRTKDALELLNSYLCRRVFVKECGSREVSHTFWSAREFEEWLTKNQRNVKSLDNDKDWWAFWYVRLAKKEVA